MSTNTPTLSKSAQRVQQALQSKGWQLEVIEIPDGARTAKDAAHALGCDVAQIVKSLIFRTKDTNQAILVLASGINRVDVATLANETNEPIQKADATFVRQVTGFAIGGIPPIGHKNTLTTYIDSDLLQYAELWAAAGTPHAVFCLPSEKLADLTGGKVITIK